jgi:two-component system cell cycle response regulator DivK
MKHILVVEDDPLNAVLFRKILEKRGGYKVSVTEDPEELFARTRAGEVDLVILDISLAHSRWQGEPVNGVELCQLLKSDPRTAAIPVVLATAHAMRGDSETLLAKSGADDYVAKPILDHAHFVDQVRRFIEDAA